MQHGTVTRHLFGLVVYAVKRMSNWEPLITWHCYPAATMWQRPDYPWSSRTISIDLRETTPSPPPTPPRPICPPPSFQMAFVCRVPMNQKWAIRYLLICPVSLTRVSVGFQSQRWCDSYSLFHEEQQRGREHGDRQSHIRAEPWVADGERRVWIPLGLMVFGGISDRSIEPD